MKKLLICLSAIAIIACKQEPKDYVTLSGKIDNAKDIKTVKIFKGKEYTKEIELKADGTFSDTLKVAEGDYTMQIGQEYGDIYLKNGNETSFTTDYEDFDAKLVFAGTGSDISNFGIKQFHLSNDAFTDDLFSNGSEEDLKKAIESYKTGVAKLKETYKDVDSLHLAKADAGIKATERGVTQYFNSKLAMRKAFPKGSPSPTFTNYENYKGGKTSLSDLKGKYVYVDLWATWCGPCKREIPSLKEVEKAFHGKNIEFVSISVDNGRGYKADTKEKAAELAHAGWKKMVADKELGGVQLYSDKAWKSDFVTQYKVNGIPRFILIDPNGNIVSADAPRPSNPKLTELLNSLENI